MILFTILALVAIVAVIIGVVAAGTFGLAILTVFGDIIVCALILYGIVKLVRLFRGKK